MIGCGISEDNGHPRIRGHKVNALCCELVQFALMRGFGVCLAGEGAEHFGIPSRETNTIAIERLIIGVIEHPTVSLVDAIRAEAVAAHRSPR
jgi:hypothetical protein